MRISKTTLAFLTIGALAAPGVDAATLVVLNKAEATASLIDLDTGKVKKTIPTGDGPHVLIWTSDLRLGHSRLTPTRSARNLS